MVVADGEKELNCSLSTKKQHIGWIQPARAYYGNLGFPPDTTLAHLPMSQFTQLSPAQFVHLSIFSLAS